MALNYTYLKYKDTYTLKNNESVTLTYSVSKVTCEATTEIKTGTILPGQTTVLNFIVDGNYSVYLASPTQVGIPFIIKHYYNLLTSFISMVEGTICGCSKCSDCEECNKCDDYLGAFMKAQAFAAVNHPVYQGYMTQITQDSICVFTEEVLCNLLHEKVYGNANVKEVMLKLIGFYYLSFYYEDKFLALDAQEKIYITEKYKFDKIAACMRKLGIMPTDPLFMTTTTTQPPVTTLPPTTSTSTTTSTTVAPTTGAPTTTPTTSTTTTSNPCALAGNAVLVVPITTTTVAPTTSTTTTTTTVAPTTSTTTTTDNPLLAACYEVEGFWELGDPIHPNGGSITYLDQYGVSHTILNITLSNGIISIIASSIVTSVGVGVTVVTCPTTAPPTTTTAGPAYTNLSQAVGGLNCPAAVSSYPYSVVASTNPIQIGTQINFTSGLPFDLNGSGYYYITPFIGYQINSLGIVTAINDCQGTQM